MRENIGLFRGKRMDNKKWVEGSFYQHPMTTKDCFILVHNYYSSAVRGFGNLGCPGFHEVDPDTVGECTGLMDKNGKLIFEGDIVRCGTGRICKVTFFTSPGVSGFDLVAIGGFDEPHPHNWVLFADTEIIGNIHDNGELMEEGADK